MRYDHGAFPVDEQGRTIGLRTLRGVWRVTAGAVADQLGVRHDMVPLGDQVMGGPGCPDGRCARQAPGRRGGTLPWWSRTATWYRSSPHRTWPAGCAARSGAFPPDWCRPGRRRGCGSVARWSTDAMTQRDPRPVQAVVLAAAATPRRDHRRPAGQLPRAVLRPGLRGRHRPGGPPPGRACLGARAGRVRRRLRPDLDRLDQRLPVPGAAWPRGRTDPQHRLRPDGHPGPAGGVHRRRRGRQRPGASRWCTRPSWPSRRWLWYTVRRQDRRDRPEFQAATGGYVVGMGVSAAVIVASAFLPAEPTARRVGRPCGRLDRRHRAGRRSSRVGLGLPPTDSLVERFGLFTIIVLGEVVFGVVDGLSAAEHDAMTIVTGMLALWLGFGFWWIYFDLVGRRLPRADGGALSNWVLSHLPITLVDRRGRRRDGQPHRARPRPDARPRARAGCSPARWPRACSPWS